MSKNAQGSLMVENTSMVLLMRGSGFIGLDIKRYQALSPWLHRPRDPFFHRDPCHWAPPARGNPSPQLPLHCFLWVITVGETPASWIPPSKHASLGSPRYTRILRRLHGRESINNPYKPYMKNKAVSRRHPMHLI